MLPPAFRLMFAAAICVLLVLHAIAWSPSQLFWPCHLASVAIALGLGFERRLWIAVGVLFHVGLGIPVFVLDLVVVHVWSSTSILTHTVPIAAGLWALWGRPLPRGILAPAWVLNPVAMLAAYGLSDPAVNVMLVHAPYPATASLISSVWMQAAANLAIGLACLALGWGALRVVWRRWD